MWRSAKSENKPAATQTAETDAALVRAAQRGDKKAFVEIVARYQGMVCGIALAILGDFAASEDAGQEAFLNAWRKIHDLREPERLRPWLAQIARNAALGQRRSKKPFEALNEEMDVRDAGPAPDEVAASDEEAELVRVMLAKLPETYREPLILYYREGQSVRAVAETLGITEDAAKQRLARGRDICRDKISATIEGVLARTKPSTLFTMAIAVAIGALAAPSAVAATAFAASAAAGTTTAGASLKTAISAFMTTSKAFLLPAAAVAMVCVPIGYQFHTAPAPFRTPSLAITAPAPALTEPQTSQPTFANSALVAQWRALHQTYGASAQAMPHLYKAIKDIKDSFQRQALSSALIAEWSAVDPAGGLAFFLAKGHSDDERQDFFREWLARDPQAAVAALMNSSSNWKDLAHDCLSDIAHAAPNQIAPIAAQLPKSDNYWDSAVHDAFAIVAQGNLDAARQAAEAITGPNRQQALAGVASIWAQSDLDAAIAWAKALPDGVDKNEIIRSALVGKAGVDPVAALNDIDVIPEGGGQMYFASTTGARVLRAAAQSDFDGTMAWIATHPGRLNGDDLVGLSGPVSQGLNADPAGFLSEHSADGTLSALMPAIGSALLNDAAGQRTAIWQWIQTQAPSDTLTGLEKEVLNSAGFQDPMAALQMASTLPGGPASADIIKQVTSAMLNGGAALYRFNDIYAAAPDSLRVPLAETAFNLLGDRDISDPQTWVANLQDLPSSALVQGAQSLAKSWGARSPGDALAWAQSLPAGAEQDAAISGLASGWAGKDAAGAANWVLSLPQGPQRDQSAAALATAVADQSPGDAWTWALSIGDTTQRNQAAGSVIKSMAGKDPATARQWIDSGPFDPTEKATLTAFLSKPTH